MSALLALVLVASGAHGSELAERRAYERAVAAATDELKLYDGWYTALQLRGTLKTSTLLAAQAARIAQLTDGAGVPPAVPDGIEVLLAASSRFPKELTLAADGTTPWTLTLRAGGEACARPSEVRFIKKPTPADRTMYPHLTDWDRVYVVRWAPDACGSQRPDGLSVHGRRGAGSLSWPR
ncbi:MAG: hypothetical protein EXR71_15315 [Myxococcales bacterium]|nr:hypothetical protein [Myxococcales bacterium]